MFFVFIEALPGGKVELQVLVDDQLVDVKGLGDVLEIDDKGFKPLHDAAFSNQLSLIQQMVTGGTDVHEKTKSGLTAFYISVYQGHWKVLTHLMKYAGDALFKDQALPMVCTFIFS